MAHTDTTESNAQTTLRMRVRDDRTASVYRTTADSQVEQMVASLAADGTARILNFDGTATVEFADWDVTTFWAAARLVHLFR